MLPGNGDRGAQGAAQVLRAIPGRPLQRTLEMPRILLALILVGMTAQVARAEVTFSKDVAPILFKHCADCHRPGEVAPMSLLSYEDARPWAKSIANQVQQRNMPPWSGESDRRTWKNDLSLSDEQIATLVQWAASGAKRGDPAEMPAAPTFPESWTLGEPDYVIELKPVTVPAEGEDLFPQEWIEIQIDEPKWIQAIEFLPGDRRVTHHFQSTISSGGGNSLSSKVSILGIWTAGMPPYVFPEGNGRVVRPGARVLVDSHYHPMGEETTDVTRIGLHFGDGELEHEVFTVPVVNTDIRIPPGDPNHEELAFHIFDRDMELLAFSPHMHVRGKAMRYDLTYPDGTKETLLDVPDYDYNWQWLYYPTEPIAVPAGSRLDVTAAWDNSTENGANPDPTREIIYRGDTFNEMFVGFVEMREVHNVYETPAPIRDRIMSLLANHPAEDSYYLGGFLPLGAYLPKDGETPGWLYIVNGTTMFTLEVENFRWEGEKLFLQTEFPTPEASATTTVIEAAMTPEGRLRGTLKYGIDREKPLTLPVNGEPLAKSAPTAEQQVSLANQPARRA